MSCRNDKNENWKCEVDASLIYQNNGFVPPPIPPLDKGNVVISAFSNLKQPLEPGHYNKVTVYGDSVLTLDSGIYTEST